MRGARPTLAGLLALFLFTGPAMAGMSLPEDIAEIAPPYRNAAVIQTMHTPDGAAAVLETPDGADAGAALDFYKTALEKKGWTVKGEFRQENRCTLVSEKGTRKFMADVSAEGGRCVINLSLTRE